jgi:hypothetical protein
LPTAFPGRLLRPAGLALAWSMLALAAGCSTDPRRDGLSPHEFASVDHIAVHLAGEQPRHRYQVLDRIEGISCNLSPAPANHPAHKVVTNFEAIYDMKLATGLHDRVAGEGRERRLRR